MRVVWSPRATSRAAEIVDYIARGRPQAALDWIEGLEKRLRALPGLPDQGRVVPEWYDPNVRELIYQRHRIIYEVHEGHVEILTIRHSRQELRRRRDE